METENYVRFAVMHVVSIQTSQGTTEKSHTVLSSRCSPSHTFTHTYESVAVTGSHRFNRMQIFCSDGSRRIGYTSMTRSPLRATGSESAFSSSWRSHAHVAYTKWCSFDARSPFGAVFCWADSIGCRGDESDANAGADALDLFTEVEVAEDEPKSPLSTDLDALAGGLLDTSPTVPGMVLVRTGRCWKVPRDMVRVSRVAELGQARRGRRETTIRC